MAIDILSSGASSSQFESFSFVVDYDTVARTIGLTCTGTGHSTLSVVRTSTQATLGALNCDQYGATSGQLTDGASDAPVTYSGSRVVVLGPGAAGVDSAGVALRTSAISSSVVGKFNVPKGQTPGLGIALTWGPNLNG
jgi:NADPH-dependent glutamate synthase beta subunit-like oxidoreductase